MVGLVSKHGARKMACDIEDDVSTTDDEFANASATEAFSSDEESEPSVRFGPVEVVEVPAPEHLRTYLQNETIDTFLQELRQAHGTILRAWRMAIDVRGSGKVSYVDFVRQCCKFGTSVQSKQLWSALSPKGKPLEFATLCPEEAANLESFSEVLRSQFGSNLKKAWEFLDSSHQNWVSLQEFSEAAEELKFSAGGAKLLFRGIDSSKLGRVCRGDLEYLVLVAGGCHNMRSKASQEITNLRARSALALAQMKANEQLDARPGWNGSICDTSAGNRSKCTVTRTYFSKPSKERLLVVPCRAH